MADYYEAPSKKSLERGLFWMTHRKMFRNILLISAFLLVFSIFGFSAFKAFQYFSSSSFEDQARALTLQKNWTDIHRKNSPADLTMYEAKSINVGASLYDLVAILENPNEEWSVSELEYHFVVNDFVLASDVSFMNPNQTSIILSPGYKTSKPIRSVEFVIDNIKWRKNENDILNVDWAIDEVVFNPTTREVDGNVSFTVPPSVTWTATNNSLYDFWEVTFQVALYNGSNLVGVREWKESKFDALEKKEFEVIWLHDLPRVSKVEVSPVLDLLDKDNLRKVEADIFRY